MFGDKIEDYEVHNVLGKGGFATVYHAQCLKSGMEVAIKLIDKKLMIANEMVRRVKEEVSIHSRLKHPSILELYAYFEDANYIYLVLELCHNGELQQFLRDHKALSESEASPIMRQVVGGMQYLHSYNIIHRDMSLRNLLLTRNMQIKISDFGLATQLSRPDEKHLTMCGTPNFISPEVALRSSHGLEADRWSLGCILYTLLVGIPPQKASLVQVCRISAYGAAVILYKCKKGGKETILPPEGQYQMYSFDSLPEKHWKKYTYASKFVDLLKAKTSKVTYYSDQAKCSLMLNLIDFEACFYKGGNVLISSTEGITITNDSGSSVTVQDIKECSTLPKNLNYLWNHCLEARNHCLILEKALSQIPATNNFPVIVGRRHNTEQLNNNVMKSFSIAVSNNSNTGDNKSSKTKQVAIPSIGIATQLSNEEIHIQFSDETQLWVDGKHVRYQYKNAQIENYLNTDTEVLSCF